MLEERVREFHAAAGQPSLDRPSIPHGDRIRLRATLMVEELFEVLDAMYGNEHAAIRGLRDRVQELVRGGWISVDLVKLADGLADLDYVVEGTRQEFGIPREPIEAEVHRANMAKFGPGSSIRDDGKVLKPPGWKPPEIERILVAHGEPTI